MVSEEERMIQKRMVLIGYRMQMMMLKEFVQMRDQIVWEKENEESSLLAILRKPSYRKRLVLGCFIQIGQQIAGGREWQYASLREGQEGGFIPRAGKRRS